VPDSLPGRGLLRFVLHIEVSPSLPGVMVSVCLMSGEQEHLHVRGQEARAVRRYQALSIWAFVSRFPE
jgi:hypothetical protein